jgi:predicted negative regulator of RcsB-dependent stress response
MSKSIITIKESIKKSGKFLREISVVVIGVAITLSVSYWIGVKKEKKDMALHLRAIRMELAENANDIGILIETLKPAHNYTMYLRLNDKKMLDKDSLNS